MLAFVLTVAVVLVLLYLLYPNRLKGIPGPTVYPLVGNLPQVLAHRKDILRYREECFQQFGPVYQNVLPHVSLIFTNEPEDIKWFLSTNFDNYIRALGDNPAMSKLLGQGIFISNGENWKQQRATARDLFKVKSMENMVPVFVAHAKTAATQINKFHDAGVPLDLYKLFSSFTMDSFTEIGFGYVLDSLEGLTWDENKNTINVKNTFGANFDKSLNIAEEASRAPWLRWFKSKEFDGLVGYMESLVYDIIRQRRKDSQQDLEKRTDLLSAFMRLRDEKGEPFTEGYLRDIVFNFMIAGRDTTAVLLTWTSYLLTQHPDEEEKVLTELRELFKDGSVPTIHTARSMKYTQQVLDETLRLYPSVPADARVAVQDDVLPSGYRVPKGTLVVYSAYSLGRQKAWWGDDVEEFKPSRWEKPPKHQFQYVPFHAGPQTCLGQNMAYLEAKAALAMLLRDYHFEVLPGHCVEPVKAVVMPPKYGLKVIIHKRKAPYSKELL